MQEQNNIIIDDPIDENKIKIQENTENTDNQGFCLIQKDEIIKIENLNLKVVDFGKREIQLEILGENVDELRAGKEVKIKAGNFVIKSFGKKFAMLRKMPATNIYDQTVLDEINKKKIEQLRKDM